MCNTMLIEYNIDSSTSLYVLKTDCAQPCSVRKVCPKRSWVTRSEILLGNILYDALLSVYYICNANLMHNSDNVVLLIAGHIFYCLY